MESGTWLGVGALVISAAGALNSMRTGKREDRSGAFAEIQAVVTTLKQENERLEKKLDESEEDCRRRVAACEARARDALDQARRLQETIVEQANRISNLERRGEAKTRTRTGDSNG